MRLFAAAFFVSLLGVLFCSESEFDEESRKFCQNDLISDLVKPLEIIMQDLVAYKPSRASFLHSVLQFYDKNADSCFFLVQKVLI